MRYSIILILFSHYFSLWASYVRHDALSSVMVLILNDALQSGQIERGTDIIF